MADFESYPPPADVVGPGEPDLLRPLLARVTGRRLGEQVQITSTVEGLQGRTAVLMDVDDGDPQQTFQVTLTPPDWPVADRRWKRWLRNPWVGDVQPLHTPVVNAVAAPSEPAPAAGKTPLADSRDAVLVAARRAQEFRERVGRAAKGAAREYGWCREARTLVEDLGCPWPEDRYAIEVKVTYLIDATCLQDVDQVEGDVADLVKAGIRRAQPAGLLGEHWRENSVRAAEVKIVDLDEISGDEKAVEAAS